jgi:hypothetical protein
MSKSEKVHIDSKSASNSAFFDTHYLMFCIKKFNFKTKGGRSSSKTETYIFYKCFLEFELATINSLGGYILSKKLKSLYLKMDADVEKPVFLQPFFYLLSLLKSTLDTGLSMT